MARRCFVHLAEVARVRVQAPVVQVVPAQVRRVAVVVLAPALLVQVARRAQVLPAAFRAQADLAARRVADVRVVRPGAAPWAMVARRS